MTAQGDSQKRALKKNLAPKGENIASLSFWQRPPLVLSDDLEDPSPLVSGEKEGHNNNNNSNFIIIVQY